MLFRSEPSKLRTGLLQDAWRALFATNLPEREDIEQSPLNEKMLYHSLVCEAFMPLRVIFGYEGYVNEKGLRDGYVKYLENMVALPPERRMRFNLNTFPNLVVCRSASIVKLDGMPYTGMMIEGGYCIWIASRGDKPFNVLLELLWTRLAYTLKLDSSIFGEDLEMEGLNPLLATKAIESMGKNGWEFTYFDRSESELTEGNENRPWHPAELTTEEFVLVNQLCRDGVLDIGKPDVGLYLATGGQTLAGFCEKLSRNQLAAVKNNELLLITDSCACMILSDGRTVAAENKSGRLLRYALRLSQETKNKRHVAHNSSNQGDSS